MSSVATLSRGQQRRYFRLGSTDSILAMPLPGPVTVSGSGDVTASVIETVTVSESVANRLSMFVSTTDSTTVSETVSNLLTRTNTVTDTVTVSEIVSSLLVKFVATTDTVTVSETVSKLLTQTNTVSDTVTISESVANLLARFASVTDTVTVTDPVVVASVIDVSVFDSVSLSEFTAFSFGIGLVVFDTVTITDALTEPLTWTIKDDDLNVLENVKVWLSFGDPYSVHNLVRDSIKFTNASGQVSYAIEWNVIYYGWRQLDGYGFTDPWVFRYNTTTMRWENYANGTWSLWNP